MATATETGLDQLDARGPTGPFRARNRQTITDVTGGPVAELSIVPALFIDRTVAALRAAAPLPREERVNALRRAGELFASAELCGLDVGDYQRRVSRVSGLALSVVEQATERIVSACGAALDQALAALPAGAVLDWSDARTQTGAALWVRRGEVFAVLAAGNHPAVNTHWLEAVALGYRVVVRPSRREPFTAARLIAAIHEAGLGQQVAFLPTDHAGADAIIAAADRSMVYGGDDVMRKYRGHPSVLPQGPGRSKILITADTDWRPQVELIAESVSRHGGVSCTSTTAVFVEGDAAAFAEALAAQLQELPARTPLDATAALPVFTAEDARRMGDHLARLAEGTVPLRGAASVVADLGDGSAALRAAVHLLPSSSSAQAGAELPFPCVWVAPWTRDDGVKPLADSLVLTVMTDDDELVDELIAQPGIRNLYVGSQPTYWTAPGVPHDGYLADFLMESKGVIKL
ncbi:aldehyde dehydrogenase family protein [Glaciibacter superstes]|uniref:aldehyde dehydrogenase family protein n=1 Tax=Glaciibacter superstes TaxID=501023 RepID=UPI0003B63B97|nr:aldehyde dehydrogenase family protein [Glaciibacter superstes]